MLSNVSSVPVPDSPSPILALAIESLLSSQVQAPEQARQYPVGGKQSLADPAAQAHRKPTIKAHPDVQGTEFSVQKASPETSESVQPPQHSPQSRRSDPRMKLLNRLNQSGLLNGEEQRRRQMRDLKDYPDIAALAHVAKTKENFYEIMGSPQASPLMPHARFPSILKEVEDLAPLPPANLGGYAMVVEQVKPVVSPASTSAGPPHSDSSADEHPSPELLPRSYRDCVGAAFDLNADTDEETPFGGRRNAAKSDSSRQTSKDLSDDTNPFEMLRKTPSPPLPEHSDRCVDPERADLLWKLAGNGSPQIKSLDIEQETDGSTKTGVYLLSSPKIGPGGAPLEATCIFKPLDEEDFERRGIELGMGALREEAAFVIDRASGGQAYVPTTARTSIYCSGVRKRGSIQQFVEEAVGPVEDFGMPRDLQAAEAMVGLDNAQAVACFDIRTFNTDRHSGNLLLAGPRPHKIVCIDHGCVLPAWWALETSRFDAWLDWPHVKAPTSEATKNLVAQVGNTLPFVVEDLEKLGLPKQAIWTLEICTSLLQKCVLTHGLTLRSVALLMTRGEPAAPCWLERAVADACIAAGASAEFKAEGKYGDLMLHVDQKIIKHFEGAEFDNNQYDREHLLIFRDAFFLFLNDTFSHTDMISAAQAAEDAARNPWD